MAFVMDLARALMPADGPGPFAGLRRALAAQHRFAAVSRELGGYSDRDLADLGISRHNVRDIAREASRSLR